jgi:hypothetical protein
MKTLSIINNLLSKRKHTIVLQDLSDILFDYSVWLKTYKEQNPDQTSGIQTIKDYYTRCATGEYEKK